MFETLGGNYFPPGADIFSVYFSLVKLVKVLNLDFINGLRLLYCSFIA